MPVLPDVASRMVTPWCRRPLRTAALTIAAAARSLTEPPGFWNSAFAYSSTPGVSSPKPRSRISGVRPIRSITESGASGRVVVIRETRSGAALAIHHFRVEGVVFGQVDEVHVGGCVRRNFLEIGEERFHPRHLDAAEECERRLRFAAFVAIELDQPFERDEGAPRRHRRDVSAEGGQALLHPAADHHEVVRR